MNTFKLLFCLTFFLIFNSSIAQVNYTSWQNSFNKGLEFENNGEYGKAIPYFQSALSIGNKIFTDINWELGMSNAHLGICYLYLGNYDNVFPFLIDGINKLEVSLGKNKIEYLIMSNYLGKYYSLTLQHKKGLQVTKDNVDIIKNNSLQSNKFYPTFLLDLAGSYYELGNYNEAINSYNEILDAIEIYFDNGIYEYSNALAGISLSYNQLKDYENALKYRLMAIEETKKFYGDKHYEYATNLNNLAAIYSELNQFEKVLNLYFESLEITKTEKGINHPNYGVILNNISNVYYKMGNYEQAIKYADKALLITKQSFGVNNEIYANRLNTLGMIYDKMNNYSKAQELFQESYDILKIALGQNHPTTNNVYYNLIFGKFYSGNYKVALREMEKIVEVTMRTTSDKSSEYSNQLNTIAFMYMRDNQMEKAYKCLNKSLEITEYNFGKKNTSYRKTLNNFCDYYMLKRDDQKVIKLFKESSSLLDLEILDFFSFRNENEKKAFLSSKLYYHDIYESFNFSTNGQFSDLIEMNLNNLITQKGLLLNSSKNIISDLKSLKDEVIDQKTSNYLADKQRIIREYNLSTKSRTNNINELAENVKEKENELVKIHNTYFKSNTKLFKKWSETLKWLKDGEVAIEFYNFDYRDRTKWTDSTMYVAYVVQKDMGSPTMIPLFEEKQLKGLLNKKTPNQLFTRGTKGVKRAVMYSDSLYQLIWKPLEKYLTNSDDIYYSPDGLLHQIPMGVLGDLGKTHNMSQLSSTYTIVDGLTEPRTNSTLLIGGVNYDLVSNAKPNNQEFTDSKLSLIADSRGNYDRGRSWNYLEGAKVEVESIGEILNNNNKNFEVLTGSEASEEAFKALSGNSPNVLHIATHGYFYENKDKKQNDFESLQNTDSRYLIADDPLIRSGLILAGGNKTWKSNSTSIQGEDGILTALEISIMDLSNTELVVLSACETGLGDIDGSEGVYGLQRAFKMAGVDLIMMSLWQVPDKETAEFMTLFYENWMKSNEVRKAFRETQLTMESKYKNEPVKWAGFVLFE